MNALRNMRRIFIFYPALVLATVLLMACAATAESYTGQVTGTNVHVRAKPGMDVTYIVTKLDAPQKVTVTGQTGEWLEILPAPGCYSVISAKYVKVNPAKPKVGNVAGTNVLVRAAGSMKQTDFNIHQTKLHTGDAVRILGKVRDQLGRMEWYIIKPPDDVRFYIHSDFVKRIGAADEPPAADSTDSDEPMPMIDSIAPASRPEPVPAAPEPTRSVKQETDSLTQIRTLEQKISAEMDKPLTERNYDALLEQARALDVPEESRFRPVYDSLVAFVHDEKQLAAQQQAARELVAEALGQSDAPTVAAQPMQQFDLEGELAESQLYKTPPGKQPYFVIREPGSYKVRGYVRSDDGQPLLRPFVGKVVRIDGDAKFDDGKQLGYFDVVAIDVVASTEIASVPTAGPSTVTTTPKDKVVLPEVVIKSDPTSPPAMPAETKTTPDTVVTTPANPQETSPAGSPATDEPQVAHAPKHTGPTPVEPVLPNTKDQTETADATEDVSPPTDILEPVTIETPSAAAQAPSQTTPTEVVVTEPDDTTAPTAGEPMEATPTETAQTPDKPETTDTPQLQPKLTPLTPEEVLTDGPTPVEPIPAKPEPSAETVADSATEDKTELEQALAPETPDKPTEAVEASDQAPAEDVAAAPKPESTAIEPIQPIAPKDAPPAEPIADVRDTAAAESTPTESMTDEPVVVKPAKPTPMPRPETPTKPEPVAAAPVTPAAKPTPQEPDADTPKSTKIDPVEPVEPVETANAAEPSETPSTIEPVKSATSKITPPVQPAEEIALAPPPKPAIDRVRIEPETNVEIDIPVKASEQYKPAAPAVTENGVEIEYD